MNEAQESAVYHLISVTGHQFDEKEMIVLDKETNWFERGVKEAIYKRIEAPSLNKRGGLWFSLSRSWGQIIRKEARRLSRDNSKSMSPENWRF